MALNEARHPEEAARRPSRTTHGDDPADLPTIPTVRESMTSRPASLLLVAPALAVVLALFIYPLGYSLVSAFTDRDGAPSLDNFIKTFALYTTDIVFTLVITVFSTALVGLLAAGIGGDLVLGAHPVAVAVLKWVYPPPLFIPLIVAPPCLRPLLAHNGTLNY